MVDGRKTAFLLPYKSLVNEKYDQFKRIYGGVGQRVIRATGDTHDEISLLLKGKYDFAFLTYEMFLGLVVNNQSILHSLGLVVLDEAQFISDPNRGITVELLLTNLLASKEKGVCPQLITLSAVIGDLNNFNKWLDCESLETDRRPVPLSEGVLDRSGRIRIKDGALEDTLQLIPSRNITQRRPKPSSQDVIVPLVKQLVGDGEKVIVFRNSRGSAQGCAKYLATELRLPSADLLKGALPSHDVTSASSALRDSLSGGVAFHTSNLSAAERELVEREFRDSNGNIHVLVATTTVAAGINTPADTVIIVEHEFYGAEKRYFTIGEYKNMAGRAGRLGYKPHGKAILLADTPIQQNQLFARYVDGSPDPLRSSFSSKHIETWLLRLLSHVGHVQRADVFRLLANTFGGYLANREDPNWFSHAQVEAEKFVGEMLRLEIAEINGDEIQLTILGRACANSLLDFRSSIRLIEVLQQLPPDQFTMERLMVLVQLLPESDNVYTPMLRKGQWEARWPQMAASMFGQETALILQKGARDTAHFRARCKRALILHDWLEGVSIGSIESKFSANAYSQVGLGDIRSIANLTRLHLMSAFQIANAMLLVNNLDNDEVEHFLKRLEFGLPESALGLLGLPKSLSRGEYLALHASGVSKLGEFWSKLTSVVSDILGRNKADEFKELATEEIRVNSLENADHLQQLNLER
ncbi:ski2-like helicase [Gimesia panareensis]|uniref:Ski2-like helicase n=2 Tax=Gimesia panareensis TaxID=2527978 RepID=A0A517Q8A9_9PLAN|nr:ski2-like helicase [Gimesia panareensis]